MPKRLRLAEIAHRLGRKALEHLAAVAKPDTLLAWYRKLIANKFDGSKVHKSWGRPRVDVKGDLKASQGRGRAESQHRYHVELHAS
jgi:hypothetical protein